MRRYTRVVKYRKKHQKLILLIKIIAIWYFSVFFVSMLTSGTQAYFNSQPHSSVSINAADSWWDGSELIFTGKNTQNVKACAPEEISVEIKNIGKDMYDSATFEVYFTTTGKPQNPHGEKVGEGVIEPLNKDEVKDIVYLAEENGFYEFKAYQHKDYEGENVEIWSEKVHVNCNAANEEKDKGDEKEQNEVESAPVNEDSKEEVNKSVEDHQEKEQDEEGSKQEEKQQEEETGKEDEVQSVNEEQDQSEDNVEKENSNADSEKGLENKDSKGDLKGSEKDSSKEENDETADSEE
ncbi:amyloid fiber anchoring/assembly protein TapA [Piscibacillus halophilus]|uniref:TasA anchoring/assembly protein n=1 Tax=Piscibacillus halophilus TaxID=571933 RepID=A0A1H9E0W5_9BACI|nr:amyloid fiber anchoring/assembly protein TapA [Piscibacillus halophilus]SEQ19341.1 TasA anchoring/assembly protein [Piscibacillus halophilus]